MAINRLLRYLMPVDPVNLSIKGKCLSIAACFLSIFLMALLTQQLRMSAAYPIAIASMGASAVILFIIPNSPLAQPWPLVGGHLVSAVIGVACARMFSDSVLASAYAVSGSVLAMLLLRCLHPPGAATALVPLISGESITALGYDFVWMPVGLNVSIMLILAIVMNRWGLGYQYPVVAKRPSPQKMHSGILVEPLQRTDISEQDMEQALDDMDMFMDVTPAALSQLLTDVQQHRFKRYRGNITCADIMVGNVASVEYGTEVEEAWQLMRREKLKAIPVIDRSRRVIGIITWNDFFKFINLNPYVNFQEKFRSFIRRTPGVTADKPEAVGQIMTPSVAVLPENAHIVELIPLMSNQGYRQIPIVNHEKCLVGMVYQANLIAALYNNSLDR